MTGEAGAETSNKISGGTFHGLVLQGGSFTDTTFVIQQAPAAPVALSQLPPLATGFTGREAELAQVACLLDPAANATAGTIVVSAVAGLGGVGKTALAVQAAYAAVSSGWFGGGVLFIDLHGYDPSPVQPGQALDALLRALGIRGEDIPEGTEQRTALYRSALAQVAGPVLIIADNASAEAQVWPLIPGPGPHRVIVTSRHILAGLRARLLDVAVLDQAAAVALLDSVVRAARPGDDRISGDLAVAGKLAGACGGLPLALQIVAALLVADPVLTAAELAGQMTDEVRRLEILRYDDGSGVSAPSVAAAFELSYRQLDQDAALLFRLLPADPGPDVSLGAAAELACWPVDRARTVIGRLTRAHLVEPAGSAGRWRMHDLLRLYARQIAGGQEREEAINRLLAWYLNCAQAAGKHLRALPSTPVSTEFDSRDDALAWLDAHRSSLIAAAKMAVDTGRYREAMALPLALSEYLDWQRRFDDLLAAMSVSRESARQLNHRRNEAVATNGLGVALKELRRFEEAISILQEAAAIYREVGARHGEGIALANLGVALQLARRLEEALGVYQDAVAIFRETGDRHGEGTVLTNLGNALYELRRYEESISAYQEAALIHRNTGNQHSEAKALGNLGTALGQVGRFDDAITGHRQALAVFQGTGDRHGEGLELNHLGATLRQVRRLEEAISVHQEAAAIYRETGDRHGEGGALNHLGITLRQVRRLEEAISAHQEAAAIYRETGDRHGEGEATNSLGITLRELQRFEEAISAHQEAAAIYRETGDPYGAGLALENLGKTYWEIQLPGQASMCWREAAAAMRDVGDYKEAARLDQLAANAQTE